MADCTNSVEKLLQIFQDTEQLFTPLKKKINHYRLLPKAFEKP